MTEEDKRRKLKFEIGGMEIGNEEDITSKIRSEIVNKIFVGIGEEIKQNPELGKKIKYLFYEHILGVPFSKTIYGGRNDFYTFWEEMFKLNNNQFNEQDKFNLKKDYKVNRIDHMPLILNTFLTAVYMTSESNQDITEMVHTFHQISLDEPINHPTEIPPGYENYEKAAPKNPKLVIIFGMSGSGKTTLADYLTHEEKYFRLLPKFTDREDRVLDEVKIGKNDVVVSPKVFDFYNKIHLSDGSSDSSFFLKYVKENDGKRYGFFHIDMNEIKNTTQHVVIETTNYELMKELKNDFPDMAKVVLMDCDLETITGRLLKRTEEINNENKKLMRDGKITTKQYLQKEEELKIQTAKRMLQNKKKYLIMDEAKGAADIILNETFEENVKKVLYELSNEGLGC